MEEELRSTYKELSENFGATFENWIANEKGKYFELHDEIRYSIAKYEVLPRVLRHIPEPFQEKLQIE